MAQEQIDQDFYAAVSSGDLERVKSLWAQQQRPNIDYIEPYCGARSLVHVAWDSRHLEVIEFLVENGANLLLLDADRNDVIYRSGQTAANEDELLSIWRVLLGNRPELINNRHGSAEVTCLGLAAGLGYAQIVEWLLDQGADPSLADWSGNTAWDTVCNDRFKDKLDVFMTLIRKEHAHELALAPSTRPYLTLGKCGATHLYFCQTASRRHICLLLDCLSKKHQAAADLLPHVNDELLTYRETMTGIRCREPRCTLGYQLRPSLQLGRTEIHPAVFAAGSKSVSQQSPDSFSVTFPYFVVRYRKTVLDRGKKTDNTAKYCVSDKVDSACIFEMPTLDEHCHPNLPERSLNRRNHDQTLTRLSRLAKDQSQEYDHEYSSVVMIAEAWLWKSKDIFIATDLGIAFIGSHVYTSLNHARTDGVFREIMKEDGVSDICVMIALLVADLVGCLENKGSFIISADGTILDAYETAIVNVAESVEHYVKRSGVESMGVEQEKGFLDEINDIREELAMFQRVLSQQEEVWCDFASNIWPEIWAKSQEGRKPYFINDSDAKKREEERALMNIILRPNLLIGKFRRKLQQLDEDGDRVERSIIIQLDVKAKHSSLREAHATAVMSAAVFGFTVITIIFTPLSFIIALFALPINNFQQRQIPSAWTDEAGMYTASYIGKWTAVTEITSVSLTIITSWLALELGLRFRISAMLFSAVIRSAIKLVDRFAFVEGIFYFFYIYPVIRRGQRFRKQDPSHWTLLKDGLRHITIADGSVRRQVAALLSTNGFLEDEDKKDEKPEGGDERPEGSTRRRKWLRSLGLRKDEEQVNPP